MRRQSLNYSLESNAIPALSSCCLFSGLNVTQTKKLLSTMTLLHLKRDELLFERGEPVNQIYLVHAGQIKLSLRSLQGVEKVLEVIRVGEAFAEAAMFSKTKRYPVDATALENTQLWTIDSEAYLQTLRDSSDACFAVMASLSKRLHMLVAEVDNITLHSASSRFATFLLQNVNDSDEKNAQPVVQLSFSKVVLASRLSIKPETLSRVIARLCDDNLIQTEERSFTILDLTGVRKLTSDE